VKRIDDGDVRFDWHANISETAGSRPLRTATGLARSNNGAAESLHGILF
jgi:hypothetical protein